MSLRRKFLSMVLALSLMLSMVGLASADLGHSAQEAAYARMSALKLAAGVKKADGSVVPALDQELTRAQMVTIIVRAFGKEQEARLLNGVSLFPDVAASHWATGYITVAKKLADEKGIAIGRPGGLFDPDANVTAAEVLAFTMKFLGVPTDTSRSWPNDYIQGALSAGMISSQDADMLSLIGNNKATRGLAFALADGAFYNYKGLPGGKSVYTSYTDTTPPTITLTGSLPESTEDEEVTISGSVDSDVVALYLESQKVTVSASGSFSVKARLAFGTNVLKLQAEDMAGNTSSQKLSIVRNSPLAAGPLVAEVRSDKEVVGVFEKAQLTAIDDKGEAITEGVTWSTDDGNAIVTSSGVFQSPVPGRYAVRATVGMSTSFRTISVYGTAAKLRIEAKDTVANGVSKKPVTVTALDRNNLPVLNFGDNEEKVSLTGIGVTVYDEAGTEVTEVTARNGSAEFWITLPSSMAGETFTLTATHDNGNDEIVETQEFEALIPIAAGLKAEGPAFIAANTGMATPEGAIKVWVVDQDGAPVFDGYEVTAQITGPAALVNTSDTYGGEDSPATFRISNFNHVGIQGKIVLLFSVDGVGSSSLTINQLIAGSPAKFEVKPEKTTTKATEPITFTVTAQDANGVPVTLNAATDLLIKLPDAVSDKFGQPEGEDSPVILSGEGSTTFTLEAKAAFLGNIEIKVQNLAGSLVGRTTVTVVAGDIETRAFDREKAIVPLMAPQAIFYGFLSDELGNPIVVQNQTMEVYVQEVAITGATTGTDTTRVTINGKTTSADKPLTVKTNAQGKVELKVAATPQNNKIYMLKLTDDGGGDPAYAYLMLVNTVPGELKVGTYKYVSSSDSYISTSRVNAAERFWVKASVTDNYGGPVMGIEDDLKIVSDDVFSLSGATLADSDSFEFRDNIWWETQYPELAEAMGLVDGDYVAEIHAGKSGLQPVKVAYDLTLDAVTGSKTITVMPGLVEGVHLNGGKDITVKVNTVTGPYVLELVDRFGNSATTTLSQEITWEVETSGGSANDKVGFRLSSGGGNVSKVTTKSKLNVYLDVNSAGVYTITFYAGSETGELTVIVE